MKFYQRIAGCLPLDETNRRRHNKQVATIEKLIQRFDTGSGFDGRAAFNWDESHRNKLVFLIPYHHMNDAGYYDGWSKLKVTVIPDLVFGVHIKITGIVRRYRSRDRDYFMDCVTNIILSELEKI